MLFGVFQVLLQFVYFCEEVSVIVLQLFFLLDQKADVGLVVDFCVG